MDIVLFRFLGFTNIGMIKVGFGYNILHLKSSINSYALMYPLSEFLTVSAVCYGDFLAISIQTLFSQSISIVLDLHLVL